MIGHVGLTQVMRTLTSYIKILFSPLPRPWPEPAALEEVPVAVIPVSIEATLAELPEDLINLLGDALPTFFIEITEVGSGKTLTLLVVVGPLLALVLDAVNGCLCILSNLGVISVGALDNIGFILRSNQG
jgi:hypothetical protein